MARVKVLSVCTHNRTRSLLMGGFLTNHMRERGAKGSVRAAGFGEDGQPPTSMTVRLLAERGIDVSSHRSRRVTAEVVHEAELIITAERMHVVDIVGRWPDAFYKTFTLPEIVERSATSDRRDHPDTESWLRAVSAARPHQLDYFEDDDASEIEDPTGRSPGAWRDCAERIDDLTRQLAGVLTSGPEAAT